MTPSLVLAADPAVPIGCDTARAANERVDSLMAEISLEEKIGQLGSRWLGNDNPAGGGAMTAPPAADHTPPPLGATPPSLELVEGHRNENGTQRIGPIAASANLDPTPMFPFGHGFPYTTFALDGLQISDAEVPTDGEFHVTVTVRNTGPQPGSDVVPLYLSDPVASVVRPVRQLCGFARADLAPGEATAVTFSVHADRTAFTGADLLRIVEPGEIDILLGTSAADLPLRGRVRLTGPVRTVGRGRRLVTPVVFAPTQALDREAQRRGC